MNTLPSDTHTTRSRPDTRHDLHRARPDEAQRRTFDRLISDAQDPEDLPAESTAQSSIDPWLPMPVPLFKEANASADSLDTEECATAPASASAPAPLPAAPADTAPPVPFVMPSAGPQASLFQHLALPLAPAKDIGRFEVLAGSAVSGVDVVQQASGGLSVVIGTSVQNAQLLDRHLALLQRRLADKVSAHVRVQERDPGRHDR